MAKKTNNLKKGKEIISLIVDLIVIIFFVSIIHLFIIKIFNLSPVSLLEKGIETSVYQQKMQIIGALGVIYIIFIICYFVFLRKFFSLGNILFKK